MNRMILVRSCKSCPFHQKAYPAGCAHPDAPKNDIEYPYPAEPPRWCPLRERAAIVRLGFGGES